MPSLFVAYEDRLLRVQRNDVGWHVDRVLADYNIEGVAAHPDAPDVVFCPTFDRGLQRSTDAGETWHRVGEANIEPDSVTAVDIDPNDPETVYAGTEPSQVYRSTDGGDTWTEREGLTALPSESQWSYPPRPDTHHVRWIEVDPADSDHLYVCVEAGALVQSHDAGETWEDRVPTALRDTHWLATHEDAPGHAWAAAGDGYAETTDGGETWVHIEEGLEKRYCWSVAVDAADPETVFLSAASGPRTAHVADAAESFLYRKRGDEWERLGDGFPDGTGILRPVLARGAAAGVIWAASNKGIYRTTDGGDSWQAFDAEWPPTLESQTPRGIVALP